MSQVYNKYNIAIDFKALLADKQNRIHNICKMENEKLLEKVIAEGDDVNGLNEDDLTPLIVCILTGNTDIGKILIKHGADVNKIDGNGNYPLHVAICKESKEFTKLLVQNGASVKNTYGSCNPPLVKCLEADDTWFMEYILDHGADIDIGQHNASPLYIAVNIGKTEHAKLLIDRGANLSATATEGQSPMHVACAKGFVDILRHLIEKKANLEITTDEGDTPLYFCGLKNQLECAKVLVETGAKLNTKCSEGDTALIIATKTKSTSVAKYLIEKGADVTIKNDEDHTAIDYARATKNKAIIKALSNNDENDDDIEDRLEQLINKIKMKAFKTRDTEIIDQMAAIINELDSSDKKSIEKCCDKLKELLGDDEDCDGDPDELLDENMSIIHEAKIMMYKLIKRIKKTMDMELHQRVSEIYEKYDFDDIESAKLALPIIRKLYAEVINDDEDDNNDDDDDDDDSDDDDDDNNDDDNEDNDDEDDNNDDDDDDDDDDSSQLSKLKRLSRLIDEVKEKHDPTRHAIMCRAVGQFQENQSEECLDKVIKVLEALL